MESLTQNWLEVVDRFYLSDFIMSGGSAFKLLLTRTQGQSADTLGALQRLAEQSGYFYVQVSAAQTRIDRIDQVFFAIARQIDWDRLTALEAEDFLRQHGYHKPDGTSLSDTEAIAEANGCTVSEFQGELRRATKREIVEDRAMCKEFRTALAHLRNAQFFPRDVSPSDAETLGGWLRGDKVSMAALRDLRIYSKIGRHNARDMLRALAHWLAKSLGKGLVIGIDLSALLVVTPRGAEHDPATLRYSRAALLDAYEVLRQFIDETDEIEHCLVCTVAPFELETDEKRSIFQYYALQSRLLNEVHDLDRQNLLASMVRLDGVSGTGVSAQEVEAGYGG
ncbi:MAG: DUF2791 family P-loop domain-containing protein [Armatimonadetes bacterium]|nr:DUF2791 family P-loop domain-containing protein [Armatimonadota bacterium]